VVVKDLAHRNGIVPILVKILRHAGTGRSANRYLAEIPVKQDPFRSQLIDVWCKDLIHPVTTQFGPQVIYGNKQDIGAYGYAIFSTGTLNESQGRKCQQGEYKS